MIASSTAVSWVVRILDAVDLRAPRYGQRIHRMLIVDDEHARAEAAGLLVLALENARDGLDQRRKELALEVPLRAGARDRCEKEDEQNDERRGSSHELSF
jgi:hypothetical protein